MYYKTHYHSPIGELVIVSDENSIVGLWIEGQKYFFDVLKEKKVSSNQIDILKKAKEWLDRYFDLKEPDINELPLSPIGGEFRQKVWKILCEIPYGEIMTYGEIAKRIAKEMNKKSMSAQAIGNAVGHNPISIIIPCHRVVGSNGNLTGYAGGIDKKIQLLELENVEMKQFYIPKNGTAL